MINKVHEEYGIEGKSICKTKASTITERFTSIISNLQTTSPLKICFQKEDLHRGDEYRKDNQLNSLQFPCRISYLGYRFDATEFHGNKFNLIF